MKNKDIVIRPFEETDNIELLTRLINQAYSGLKDMGLNYVAATQDTATTSKRITKSHITLIVEYQSEIIGTVSLYSYKTDSISITYQDEKVCKIGQFAVKKDLQGKGIGKIVMAYVENLIKDNLSMDTLALDTSKKATHLIGFYENIGYKVVEEVSWKSTNYDSYIMTKKIE